MKMLFRPNLPGEGIQPMRSEVHLKPREQARLDLIVEVERAVLTRNPDKLRHLRVKCLQWPCLLSRIDEAMNA